VLGGGMGCTRREASIWWFGVQEGAASREAAREGYCRVIEGQGLHDRAIRSSADRIVLVAWEVRRRHAGPRGRDRVVCSRWGKLLEGECSEGAVGRWLRQLRTASVSVGRRREVAGFRRGAPRYATPTRLPPPDRRCARMSASQSASRGRFWVDAGAILSLAESECVIRAGRGRRGRGAGRGDGGRGGRRSPVVVVREVALLDAGWCLALRGISRRGRRRGGRVKAGESPSGRGLSAFRSLPGRPGG